ncbi:ubiquitin related modifier 1 [Penicillium cosmopolitanum]|uniref:Ubiquitin-related modifier 1 n=1 Tax=Penicillium cosmopolitanum TaxID=1131564 RepID=A0A9X0BA02_9EURO|nr:ubiquitin related modifier 1 [Penicillium cosmopolitanum]KAJ5397291.1 ubiquitin related modifier 1 [Penicillium cosmopolitanum]
MANSTHDGAAPTVSITVEFTYRSRNAPDYLQPLTKSNSGGLEILFSNERKHTITLPARLDDASQPTIAYLLQHLVDNHMKDDRKELFIMEDNVRPGILVLINDADWELEGEENYELQQGDNIVFVSTLHGG